MSTSFIELQASDNTSFQAYVSKPSSNGKHPAILVMQEAFGINNHIRNVCDRFAAQGYVAIAPELFHRTAPKGFTAPYSDFALAFPHYMAITTEGLSADFVACYKWLQRQEFVVAEKIGTVGFCMGGKCSFLANAILPLSASVSYYGGKTSDYASMAAQLHAPQLFFWGGQDHHIPEEEIQVVIDALKGADKPYTNVMISDAHHGFNCDERPSYHPTAAKESWAMTLAFLENHLK